MEGISRMLERYHVDGHAERIRLGAQVCAWILLRSRTHTQNRCWKGNRRRLIPWKWS